MEYLKDEQYYIDFYDLLTIKKCLDMVKMFHDIYIDSSKDEKIKDIPDDEKKKGLSYLLKGSLYAVKASEYKKKQEAIQKWLEDDRIKQHRLDNASVPERISCPKCKIPMTTVVTKHLEYYGDGPMRVMFLFRCTKCKKQEWVYDNGEMRVSPPDHCPKCNKEIEISGKRKGKVFTWIKKCTSCGYFKKEVEDFSKNDAERKKKEEEDKLLLETFRKDFCLSDEEGKEHIETIEAMKVGNKVYEEEVKKYDSKAYQTMAQIKKLTIMELEALLNSLLGKEKYVQLAFNKPEIGEHVIISFSIQDADPSRKSEVSISNIQKVIKDGLEETNWRLMSDGVSYRLGYITGRLKGYEREEDFFELAGRKKESEGSQIDDELLMKYRYPRLKPWYFKSHYKSSFS